MCKNKSVPFFTLDLVDITATLADGTELPGWLTFDANTLTFSGTPTIGDEQIIDVVVNATDAANKQSTIDFNLTINEWRQAA